MNFLKAMFGNYSKREVKRIQPIADKVLALESKYAAMSESELKNQTTVLKERLANGETTDDILPDAFAACREASWRVLGMKHFPVQVLGGIVLHQGRIAEMKTGEGKTLVATLPAYLNALTGNGVHIVTVNDYLARRDSEWMGKLYKYMGLKVGLIVHDLENSLRKEAYAADITYGTNNELGFDYLRDNMVVYKENKVQRGHAFAIVDEVDSILIDEARTPLIISGKGDKSTDLYEKADVFAKTLKLQRFTELDSKEDMEAYYEENGIDYVVDEKQKTATLTQLGVKKAEEHFGLENLTDPENLTISHHINQAIKANGVMKLDVDYVVKDGEVIIVDEFTGRLMYGRRFNEGLHQAIEAKEGVKVQSESKTLATITFQNYFRLYGKLSGMTGTGQTESEEFQEIYKLDVVEVPTNKPVIRKDLPDSVFKTERGKFNAVIDQIVEANQKGQPVLVGTISIEKSELLSKLLKRRGVKHNVLNAKQHDKEAEIVAQAGKYGAVTIATNMAGRGTDIILGGNAEYMAKASMRKQGYPEELIEEATGYAETDNEEILEARKTFRELNDKYKEEIKDEADRVREAGGLMIIGTERHESRRIDNQLRGRSGRQGDPGVSRFFLSTEDDLMRLFGGDRMKAMMERMNVDEDTPIENKMLSNIIESSQEKVELRNFGIRKDVLQYDDVLNRQREIIYGQRDQVLNGEDLHDTVLKMVSDSVDTSIAHYLPEGPRENWNYQSLVDYYKGWIISDEKRYAFDKEDLEDREPSEIGDMIKEDAYEIFKANEELLPAETIREMERVYLLKAVDTHWMAHIDAMDQLKAGIRLRSYGQHDPVVEYRLEGFDMFDEMIENIREDTMKMMLIMPKRVYEIQKRQEAIEAARKAAEAAAAAAHKVMLEKEGEKEKAQSQPSAVEAALKREQVAQPTRTSGDGTDTANKTVRKGKKVGRNDPCPCGSGKKYKKCCGRDA
ncbi:preprotein translocase subunit SecA [Ruminococcus sp.]|uniref:preprotein translocase subunit SecA n=1 Tax=Ruminococcus sp. TaxID=41978 RepID=UPI002E798BCC|nr:preprotein translocase subunit SecA [Ruminococcus sp.]MEE1264009.1 preprotein translocase subunit SecA [Ruminococcus sp.]